jgi:hypothetical protein
MSMPFIGSLLCTNGNNEYSRGMHMERSSRICDRLGNNDWSIPSNPFMIKDLNCASLGGLKLFLSFFSYFEGCNLCREVEKSMISYEGLLMVLTYFGHP